MRVKIDDQRTDLIIWKRFWLFLKWDSYRFLQTRPPWNSSIDETFWLSEKTWGLEDKRDSTEQSSVLINSDRKKLCRPFSMLGVKCAYKSCVVSSLCYTNSTHIIRPCLPPAPSSCCFQALQINMDNRLRLFVFILCVGWCLTWGAYAVKG